MKTSADDLACRYVLDQLDPHERAVFEARLLREPELVALVRDFETGLEEGVRLLPRSEPPPGLLHRIESAIDRGAPVTTPAAPRGWSWTSVAQWGIAAVIAVSLAILAWQSLRPAPAPSVVLVGLDPERGTTAELSLPVNARDPDARFMQLASLAQNLLKKPQSPAAQNRGYALFDPDSRQGFIAIEQLPALESTQRYHLWVADAHTGRVRDAGVLPMAGSSRGLYSFALAADKPESAGVRFFVTVEDDSPTAPADRPHGKVVLGDRPL